MSTSKKSNKAASKSGPSSSPVQAKSSTSGSKPESSSSVAKGKGKAGVGSDEPARSQRPPELLLGADIRSDRDNKGKLPELHRSPSPDAQSQMYRSITISPPIEDACAKMTDIRQSAARRDYVEHIRFVVPCAYDVNENVFKTSAGISLELVLDDEGKPEEEERSPDIKWRDYNTRKTYALRSENSIRLLSKVRDLPALPNLKSIELIGPRSTKWGEDFPLLPHTRDEISEDFGALTIDAIGDLTLGKEAGRGVETWKLSEIRMSRPEAAIEGAVSHSVMGSTSKMAYGLRSRTTTLSVSSRAFLDLKDPFLNYLEWTTNLQELELNAYGIGTAARVVDLLARMIQRTVDDSGSLKVLGVLKIRGPTDPSLREPAEVVKGTPFRNHHAINIDSFRFLIGSMHNLRELHISNMGIFERVDADRFRDHIVLLDFLRSRPLSKVVLKDVPEFDRFGRLKQRRTLAAQVNAFVNKSDEQSLNPLARLTEMELDKNFPATPTIDREIEPWMWCRRMFARISLAGDPRGVNEERLPKDKADDDRNDKMYRRTELFQAIASRDMSR